MGGTLDPVLPLGACVLPTTTHPRQATSCCHAQPGLQVDAHSVPLLAGSRPLSESRLHAVALGELSQEGWHFLCRMGCSCNRSYRAGLIPVSISWPRLVLRTFCVAPAGASPVFGTLPNTVH